MVHDELLITGEQRREDPRHRLPPATGQQQHGPGRIVADGRSVVGGRERMSDKLHRQRRVGITSDLEGKNDGQGVEVLGHREAAAGLPGPDLRADVVQRPNLSADLPGQSAGVQRPRQAQVETRIIDKAHRARPVPLDPGEGRVEEQLKETEVLQHFHQTDHGGSGQVMQQLRPRRRQPGTTQRAHVERRLLGQKFPDHARGVLVTRMLAGDHQQIHLAAGGRRQAEGQLAGFRHWFARRSRRRPPGVSGSAR